MTPSAAYDLPRFLFSFEGRATRTDLVFRFWIPYLLLAGLAFVVDMLSFVPVASALLYVASFWPMLAVSARRAHDRGRSGWFILIGLIPLVQLWLLVELFLLPGTLGPNEFGKDPRGSF